MAITKEQLTEFQQFAEEKLASDGVESIEDLVVLWRLSQQATDRATGDLAAIRRGVDDADAGRVRSVEEAFCNVRQRLDLDR